MRKRVHIALAILLVVIAGVIAWQVLRPHEREPVYQGKALGVWLREYGNGTGVNAGAAYNAVRKIGTNAIPTLLKMLRTRDSPSVSKLILLWNRHIGGIRYLPHWVRHPAWFENEGVPPSLEAAEGFGILGADAQKAVPELIKIYEQNFSEQSQYAASRSLIAIGPAGLMAIPSFLRGATNSNPRVRIYAIHALALIHAEPAVVVPVLTKFLRDTNITIRGYAARGLGEFGTNAQQAVPAVHIKLCSDHRRRHTNAALASARRKRQQ